MMKKYLAFVAPLAFAMACSGGDDASADADGDGEVSAEEMADEVEAAAISMTPGTWEATIQFTEFNVPNMPEEMRGMMQEQMGQPQTSNSCITQEQAENPEAEFFSQANDDCTYTDFNMSGGEMRMVGSCDAGNGMQANISMQGTYTSTTYDMTISTDMTGGPMGEMSMTGQVQGRHVSGDCAEG